MKMYFISYLCFINCNYLISLKQKITFRKAIEIAYEISKGCEYLEQNKMVHRDIAARNCLLNKDLSDEFNIQVKLGDFGLTRSIYLKDYYKLKANKPMPIRWMSPEALNDGIYTHKSDVW